MKRSLKLRIMLLTAALMLLGQNVFARNGIYVTVDGGSARQAGLPNAAAVGANSTSSKPAPNSSRFGVGYNHDLFPYLGIGLDIGYGHYGEEIYHYPTNETEVRSSTLEFLMLLQYHFTQFDLFGKAGGLRQTVHITGFDAQPNQTQIAPLYAIGIALPSNQHLAVIFTYAHISSHKKITTFSETQNKSPTVNACLVGLRYTF